ncbi:Riboflavin synthase [Trichinella pseudospiralis]
MQNCVMRSVEPKTIEEFDPSCLIWFSLMNMRLLKRIRFVVVQHLLYAFQKDCIGRRIEIYCFSFSYGCGRIYPR